LAYTSPTFNTILRAGRIGFVSFDFINFAGTDLSTITATVAFFLIDNWIHRYFKFQIDPKQKYLEFPIVLSFSPTGREGG